MTCKMQAIKYFKGDKARIMVTGKGIDVLNKS